MLALFGPLWSPATALATRDFAFFHLPLRADFARLAAAGPPVWNPWLNGGQPLLSNPSYGAFYPPSWLVLAVTPAYAINLLVLLHAALAFAGAWVLARRLGGDRGAAAIAATGYVAAGAFVSLLHAFNLFLGMAWFPWVVAAGEAILHHPEGGGRGWWRPAAGGAAAFALQMLNGEPVTVLISRARPSRPRRHRGAAAEAGAATGGSGGACRPPRGDPDPAHGATPARLPARRRPGRRQGHRLVGAAGATGRGGPPPSLRRPGPGRRASLLRLGPPRPALPVRHFDLSGPPGRRAGALGAGAAGACHGAVPGSPPSAPASSSASAATTRSSRSFNSTCRCWEGYAFRRSSCSSPSPSSPSPPRSAGSG